MYEPQYVVISYNIYFNMWQVRRLLVCEKLENSGYYREQFMKL